MRKRLPCLWSSCVYAADVVMVKTGLIKVEVVFVIEDGSVISVVVWL